jgi:hypothetical protein
LAYPGAAHAREGADPAAAQVEETARAREERTLSLRAHTSARAEGGNGATVRRCGRTGRLRGKKPGRRWPDSWTTGRYLSTGRGWRT